MVYIFGLGVLEFKLPLSLLLIGSKKDADGKSWQNSRDELQNIGTSKYYTRTFLLTSLLISLLIPLYML